MSIQSSAVGGELNDLAETVKRHMGAAVSNMITVGQALQRAKQILPHGQFGAWLNRVGFDQRTAQRMMTASARFAHRSGAVSHLAPGLVYELAAPSTPDDVVEAVLERRIPATLEAVRDAKHRGDASREAVTTPPRRLAARLLEQAELLLCTEKPEEALADALWEEHEDSLELAESVAAVVEDARALIEDALARDRA